MHTHRSLVVFCRYSFTLLALVSLPQLAAAVTLHPGDIVVAGHEISGEGALFRVDPTTGDRTVISDATHGDGIALDQLGGIALGADRAIYAVDQIFNVDQSYNTMVRIDPATGNRTVVSQSPIYQSSTVVGNGPFFDSPYGIAREASGSLLVLNAGTLLRVDPTTGDRTIVSGGEVGGGAPMVLYPDLGIALNSAGDVFLSSYYDGIIKVDPTTGDRSRVAYAGNNYFNGLVADSNGKLFVMSWSRTAGGIFVVDSANGEGNWLSGVPGDGSIAIDPAGKLIVAEYGTIFRIDPVTGAQTIVSNGTHGMGINIGGSSSIFVVPVPEPSTLALGLSGIVPLSIAARRRWRRLRLSA